MAIVLQILYGIAVIGFFVGIVYLAVTTPLPPSREERINGALARITDALREIESISANVEAAQLHVRRAKSLFGRGNDAFESPDKIISSRMARHGWRYYTTHDDALQSLEKSQFALALAREFCGGPAVQADNETDRMIHDLTRDIWDAEKASPGNPHVTRARRLFEQGLRVFDSPGTNRQVVLTGVTDPNYSEACRLFRNANAALQSATVQNAA